MNMNYTVRQISDVTVLDLSGRISPGESISDRLLLQELVGEQVKIGHNKILINLREVTYINSSGIAGLLASVNTVRDRGGELRVCNANRHVSEVLRRTHLDAVFHLEEDELRALQAFSEARKKAAV